MLTSVEGFYENGVVRLLEPLPGVAQARVVVTTFARGGAFSPFCRCVFGLEVEAAAYCLVKHRGESHECGGI